VKIRVYRTEGTSTGDTVYLGSKCLADYGDIRFVASDNTTELSYWMEANAGSYADFWVKIPSIVSDSSIYIYYGNSSATTTSNGDDTFVFFDDFSSGSVDSSKWTITGTPVITSGIVRLTGSQEIVGKTSFGVGYSLYTRAALFNPSGSGNYAAIVFNQSPGMVYIDSNNGYTGLQQILSYNGTSASASTITTNTSTCVYRIEKISASSCKYYRDSTLLGEKTVYLNTGSGAAKFSSLGSGYVDIDYVFVKVYSTTEPTHVSWSEEQEVASYPLKITINPTSGTDPLSVSYNLSISDALDNFTLSYGDGQEYTGDDITSFATTHTYNTPGTYTVWAEGYNEFATHVFYEIPYGVTVNAEAVVASFSIDQTYNTVTFTNTSTGNINECYWDFGDGRSSYEQNPVHTYHTAGTYTVTLYTSNQYQYDDDDQEIVVSEILVIPDAYFKPSRHISIYPVFPLSIPFTNLSNTDVGCTYLWDFGNDTTSTDENPTAIYDELGTYDVSLTITNPLGTSIRSYIDAVYLLECPFIIAKEQVVVSDTMHGFAFTLIHEVIEVVDQIIRSAICRETVKVYNGDDFMVQGHDEYGIGHTRSRHNEYGIHIIRKKFSQFGAKITQAIRNRTNTDCVGIEQIAVCRETVYVNVSTQDDESP
jgi:PKD repeat protein